MKFEALVREHPPLLPGRSWHRRQAVTEDCARRRVQASNRRSRHLASRRNAGGIASIFSLFGLLPALNISPFLFRPSVRTGAPMHYGMISAGDHGCFYPLREHSPGGRGWCIFARTFNFNLSSNSSFTKNRAAFRQRGRGFYHQISVLVSFPMPSMLISTVSPGFSQFFWSSG